MKTLQLDRDEAQDLRKKGYWILSDKKFNKIYMISKDKDKIIDAYNKEYNRTKRHNINYWSALKKVEYTQTDIDRADRMYRSGLNCPMSVLYS